MYKNAFLLEFIPSDIDQYCGVHTSPESDLLSRLNRETHAKVLQPRMLSGHLQGRLLSMLSHMIQPRLILEIGTYTGYSALCMAEGLVENGKIITIDVNEELEDFVRGFFGQSEVGAKIDFRIGNALTLIPQITEPIDMVFIDADKKNYANYYELVFDKLRTGGYIIADNVLWSGKVSDPAANDKDTLAMRAFNDMIQDDKRVENILLPIRDGLMVLRKK